MRVQVLSLSAVTLAVGIVLADDPKATSPKTAAPSFDATVTSLFTKSCDACHNDRLASGGLNLGPFTNPASLMSHREEWERGLKRQGFPAWSGALRGVKAAKNETSVQKFKSR